MEKIIDNLEEIVSEIEDIADELTEQKLFNKVSHLKEAAYYLECAVDELREVGIVHADSPSRISAGVAATLRELQQLL